jgi:hypothetical protein
MQARRPGLEGLRGGLSGLKKRRYRGQKGSLLTREVCKMRHALKKIIAPHVLKIRGCLTQKAAHYNQRSCLQGTACSARHDLCTGCEGKIC